MLLVIEAIFVAVAALPDVSWLPDVLTPGKSMFELPLNETPPIVLAVAKIVDFGAVKVDASDKSVLAIVMFALPSKDCPAIVLAVSNKVAVAALPVRLAVTPPEAVIELSFKTTPSIVTPESVVSSLIVSTFNPSSARIGPLNVVVFPVEPTETSPVIVVILA